MSSIFRPLILIMGATLIVGCNNDGQIENLEKRLSSIQEEQKTLSEFVNSNLIPHLNQKFRETSDNSYRLLNIERGLDSERTVVFDFSDKGYRKLETASGFFLVLVEDVKPYADGVKIVLKIGNPLFGSFKGFKMNVKYGPREPEFPTDISATDTIIIWQQKNDKWKAEITEKELDFIEELLPGSWNQAVMILPKIKPTELGYLEITMYTNTIALSNNGK